jgi:hypothetical protein
MSDPFREYMDIWAPSVGVNEAFNSWLQKSGLTTSAYVVGDIQPFMDTSGKYIEGRAAWREHLAATGSVEFGHSDLRKSAEEWTKKNGEAKARAATASKLAPAVDSKDARPVAPSEASRRVMARLHGRAAPDRKTLIQIAMEERGRR